MLISKDFDQKLQKVPKSGSLNTIYLFQNLDFPLILWSGRYENKSYRKLPRKMSVDTIKKFRSLLNQTFLYFLFDGFN